MTINQGQSWAYLQSFFSITMGSSSTERDPLLSGSADDYRVGDRFMRTLKLALGSILVITVLVCAFETSFVLPPGMEIRR